ncbi:ATP-binding protein [Ramlibacter sp. XY19]|uniref:hybrid sensor histidine kinase/response regulator n=1 Tax=Ramlibacter paludis TaxID=2908000 RepID=UPI0023D9F28F|nr:ATP-binding protein [Ramlibacter paludis]MCG2594615.1 ATP-binding protein [Ramlibacter paludis]
MPLVRPPASIRSRLVLLLLALWVPAVIALGLQARAAYEREESAARDELRQQANALSYAMQAELDRRVSLGKALAALPSLKARDFEAFLREARLAVEGSDDAVLLVDRERQYAYTAQPAPLTVARRPGSLFVERGMGVSFVLKGPVSGNPAIAVLVPEAGVATPQFNVGVTFLPARVQEVIAQQPYRANGLATVLDAQLRVMGRSRDAERYMGVQPSNAELRALAARRGSGFMRTVTLDGVASLTYLAPPGRFGWSAVVALPEAQLQEAAQRLAVRASLVSALLLALGLGLAAMAARSISRPVRALNHAAGELLAQRVPERLHTGVAEVDQVGAVLHGAGVRARHAEQELALEVARAVDEARQAEASLLEARKHEAIGRLTGGIAHDFNNLLQTISMGLQVVYRSVPAGRYSRSLEAAMAACGKAADQVRQMLAFGRTQQLRPQAVDLADLLLRTRELTGKALGERVALRIDIDPALPPLHADPVQLELALLNLVFNARDAMPQGGTVTLRAAQEARASDGGGGDGAPLVRIDVEDTGHGMDAETLARVFEPYFTTKPVGAGSGLGLPQVQAFARQSGGDVRITSTLGNGTCVTLLLPMSLARATAGESPAVARERKPRRPLRVLMVEDDVLVASVVPGALEHEGHQVTLCRTADEARALLEQQDCGADVLFTDIVMPGTMTGLDLVEWCRVHCPKLPALVATGYSSQPLGAAKVLNKPYAVDDLLDALEACAASADRALDPST